MLVRSHSLINVLMRHKNVRCFSHVDTANVIGNVVDRSAPEYQVSSLQKQKFGPEYNHESNKFDRKISNE